MARMDWEYVTLDDVDLEGAFVVVGMPSVGMVGPIAASFLVEQQGMRVIGGFQSDALPPVAIVRQGLVTSPVQAWATEIACGLDGKCDRLVVVKSDLGLPVEVLGPLAGAISAWAKKRKASMVVGLEGYARSGGPEGQKGVLCATSLLGAPLGKKLGAPPVEEATLNGFNAAMLVRANRDGLAAAGLFAPAEAEEGDAEAAATLLELIDPLVPNIHLAPAELRKRAEALEQQLKEAQAAQDEAQRTIEEKSHRGYA